MHIKKIQLRKKLAVFQQMHMRINEARRHIGTMDIDRFGIRQSEKLPAAGKLCDYSVFHQNAVEGCPFNSCIANNKTAHSVSPSVSPA